MKSAGVIVEYNPFHNGHLYHLQQTKEVTKPDVVVAVMSGYFLQRGEPALLSKWERAKMAMLAGVDLVVELPYAFSTQKAELFANGAISILEALKVDEVCFGSESGDIHAFTNTVNCMNENEMVFNELVQKFIKEGNSFPKSASLAFQSLNLNGDIIDLSLPNNILGYHYVKAIIEQNARIKPKTITRTGANYHDEVFNSPTIASATSIRKALFSLDGTINEIQNFVPTSTYSTLEQYISNYGQLHQWENYFHLLKYKLLTTTPSELEGLYEMEEGLEYRFISNVKDSVTFNDFMEKMKTKRYTWTRLQRACTHVLTHTSKDVMRSVSKQKKASYIRLLGMSQNGRKYLNKVKKDLPVPVISKLSNSVDDMLSLDIKAANTYAMGFPEPIRSEWLRIEYSTPPIQYDEQEKLFL